MIVLCTVPDEDFARELSRKLVQEGLCACVNQIPHLRSYYIYEGKFCEDDELLLLMKTDEEHYERLQKRILELHPYETPEIIATKIDKALPAYMAWLQSSLK
jgi:periplasmic divalent cation tolerance protein